MLYNSAILLSNLLKKSCEKRGEKARIRKITGFSGSQLDAYVNGTQTPSLDKVDLLAEALEMKPWELIRPDATTPPPQRALILAKMSALPDGLLPSLDAVLDGLLKSIPHSPAKSPEAKKAR